ncbi:FAD-binding domain-containing protein [Phlegmacium glaucopus]|nr:FAD-binding domain-containing protein [Phlegmacium glaucopus]
MSNLTSLKQSFKGDISTPTDDDYAQAIGRWALNAQTNAQIVAFVKTPDDVALAIAYAKENKLPIAIRGGGHSTAGASSTEGLVIDLSRHLNTVQIHPEDKLAYVGGGAIWEYVDRAAIQHDLATVGGTVNHTGVGGLTLGGGVGLLTGEHGLVIDNLVKVTIVTSDGSILTASETENSDLFWGIRGGGCNFGVVTQFVLKLHPQRRTVFAGPAVYSPDTLEQLFEVANTWWSNVGEKEALSIALTIIPTTPTVPQIAVQFFYNGSEAEGRANFKPFFDLKPIVDLAKEIPYEALNGSQNAMLGHGQGRLIKSLSHIKPHLPSTKKVIDRLLSLAGGEIHPVIILEYTPFKKIQSIPNGTCAFRRPTFAHGIALMTWRNITAENLTLARTIARELADIVATGQQEQLGHVEQGYGNYDQDVEEEDGVIVKNKAEALFLDNYPRLQELKKKYDPENIFNKWFAITPSP